MINKVILVGRLTSDPEVKQTQSGLAVVSFAVACNRQYEQNGERKADFINCVAWRKTAEFIGKYFKKGNSIGIEGSIQTRKYQDKDGNKRIAVEVLVEKVSFVESNNQKSDGYTPSDTNAPPSPDTDSGTANYSNGSVDDFVELESDTDLPF
ncbi:MAG: single-stranded DNA-binding protein [Oscillospiraceae bacterium]